MENQSLQKTEPKPLKTVQLIQEEQQIKPSETQVIHEQPQPLKKDISPNQLSSLDVTIKSAQENKEQVNPKQQEVPLQPTQQDYDQHDITLKLIKRSIRSSDQISDPIQMNELTEPVEQVQNMVEQSDENLFSTQQGPKADHQLSKDKATERKEEMIEQKEQLSSTKHKEQLTEIEVFKDPSLITEEVQSKPVPSVVIHKIQLAEIQGQTVPLPIIQKIDEEIASSIIVETVQTPGIQEKEESSSELFPLQQTHLQPQSQPKVPQVSKKVHPQNEYINSIEQINRILQDKQLSQQAFIKIMLKNFSPFVQIPLSQENDQQIDLGQNQITSNIFDLKFLQKYSQHQEVQNLIRYNCIFHARIMQVMFRLTRADSDVSKELRFPLSKDLTQLKSQFLKLKLRASFTAQLWTHKRQFQSTYSSYRTNYEQKHQQKQDIDFGSLKENDLFCRIEVFLQNLGFNDPNHQFNKKMTYLTRQSYKIRYIEEFAYYSFKNAKQVERFLTSYPQCNRFNNLKFYCNRQRVSYKRLHIDDIHQKKATDYHWLEATHDYIQWLFPNHFQSNFNYDSYALGYVEAEIFKKDSHILEKLVKSFMIYLNFMGCILKREFEGMITIELVRTKQTFDRLEDCLVYHTHNHLRIMRILACLSVTGLRAYAEAFLRFLNSPHLSKVLDYKRIQNPLETMWNLYQQRTPQQKRTAREKCFLPYKDFPLVKESSKLIDKIEEEYKLVKMGEKVVKHIGSNEKDKENTSIKKKNESLKNKIFHKILLQFIY